MRANSFKYRSHTPSPLFAHKSPGFEVFAPQPLNKKKRHLPATPFLMHPVAAAVGRGVLTTQINAMSGCGLAQHIANSREV